MDSNLNTNNQISNKKHKLKLISSIIANTIFVVFLILIAFLVYSMVHSKVTGGPPSIAGHQIYIVIGGSMGPTFEAGSLAILESVDAQDISIGDIITYRSESSEGVTTHRVMEVHYENGQFSFTTRGDANDVNDSHPVLAKNIIGRVIYTIPYVGHLMYFAQTKKGLALLVIIPGLLLIFFELRFLIRYAQEWEKEKSSNKEQSAMASGDTKPQA